MENKMLYTAPEITVVELNTEDIVLISVDTEVTGTITEIPFAKPTPPQY